MNHIYGKKTRSGSALMIAIMLVFTVLLLIPTAGQLIVNSYNETKQQQKSVAAAENVARAGLVDAISWFKRQTSQPVSSGVPPTKQPWADGAFNPRYSTSPASCDTIEESSGLVKQYTFNEKGSLWARYEVLRQTNPAIAPYDPHAVHDYTAQRLYSTGKQAGEGIVWYIECTGYIYRNRDGTKRFNVSPNEVIAKTSISTEIKRISLMFPDNCAVITKTGGTGSTYKIIVNNRGQIDGGNAIACGRNTGTNNAKINTGGAITGAVLNKNGLSDPTVYYVLGLTTAEVKCIADYSVTSVTSLPDPIPDMSFIFIDGNATFTKLKPLKSSGILLINGSLTIEADSNSYYSGLIYVTGTSTIYDPVTINGCVVAYNGLTLSRSNATDQALIQYDNSILDTIRQRICLYRENKAIYHVRTGIAGL